MITILGVLFYKIFFKKLGKFTEREAAIPHLICDISLIWILLHQKWNMTLNYKIIF